MSTKPNKSGKKWTEFDHNQLLDLIEKDYTIEDIALKLERTVAAIKTKLLKETYELINQGDWTIEELSDRFNLPALEILRYQVHEDEMKMNPPQKRTTRSETKEKEKQESEDVNSKRSFSSATKTRNVLVPLPKSSKEVDLKTQTYEEKSLALLTEIRDSLRIIAAKK